MERVYTIMEKRSIFPVELDTIWKETELYHVNSQGNGTPLYLHVKVHIYLVQ